MITPFRTHFLPRWRYCKKFACPSLENFSCSVCFYGLLQTLTAVTFIQLQLTFIPAELSEGTSPLRHFFAPTPLNSNLTTYGRNP